jgi:hypothetical protein
MCLARHRDSSPEAQAEALADEIERTILIMRELQSGVFSRRQEPATAWESAVDGWPGPSPSSVVRQPAEQYAQPSANEPPTAAPSPAPAQADAPPPIMDFEPSAAPERPATPQAAAKLHGRKAMPVEELNLLIQERTPPFLDVPVDIDGRQYNVRLNRDVISAHVEGCVRLVYQYPKAPQEIYVYDVISVDDLPVDLSAIVSKLTALAKDVVKPLTKAIVPTPPKMPDGPVTAGESAAPSADTEALLKIWSSIGS